MTLSVVVADGSWDRSAAARSAGALRRELADGDELIWVHRPDVVPPPGARAVAAPGADRGGFYAAGLAAAACRLVAFTDSVTEVQQGWRDAAVALLEDGAVVVGGPVEPVPATSLRSAAGFFVEYGPHAVAPFTSATGDIAANNVAYSVPALSRVIEPGEPVWKSIVDRRLAALGYRPIVDRGMRVVSLKRYRWRDLAPARVAHGRLYASQRAIGWPRGQRWLSALLCGALPLVAFARLARRVRPDPELRRQFVKAAPLVALALAAWSVGEAVGYVAGAGNHVDVF